MISTSRLRARRRDRPFAAALLALLAAVMPAALLVPGGAAAQPAELRMSVVVNAPIPIGQAAFIWAERIAELSEGRITARVFPGSSLVGGDQTREITAMRQGTIDLIVGSSINIAVALPELGLFSLPYLIPDDAAFDAVIAGPPRATLDAVFRDVGIEPVAWGAHGFRALSNSVRPVRTPEDMEGLRIRVVTAPIFLDIFEALGADPIQMAFVDLLPALSTGDVSGQENPVTLFVAAKMWDLGQRHLTLLNHMSDAAVFLVRGAVWEGWDEADRALVAAAAAEAAAELTAMSRAGLGGDDRSAFETLAAHGVEVVELDAAARAAFAERTRPVLEAWIEDVGADLVRAAEDAVAASR